MIAGPPQLTRRRGKLASVTIAPVRARTRVRRSAVREVSGAKMTRGGCAAMVSIGRPPVKCRP
jgi:hypothetical protein